MDNSYHFNTIYIQRLYVNNTFSYKLLSKQLTRLMFFITVSSSVSFMGMAKDVQLVTSFCYLGWEQPNISL